MLISSEVFTYGLYFWRLWLTCMDTKWCAYGPKLECWNCTFIVTVSVKCGYWTRSNLRCWQCRYSDIYLLPILFECLSFYLPCCTYVSMGIVAQMGKLPAREQCHVIHPNDLNDWKVQTSMYVSLCNKESLDSSVMESFVILRILMRGLIIYDSLMVVMTFQHS